MLQVQNLGKRYGSRLVLRNVSFEAEPGQTIGVLGANGSGKSTLLRLICGLTPPSEGRVLWRGASARGQCALAAPGAPVYRELTCLENLSFFAQGAPAEALSDHLARWGLEKRGHDLAADLSSGLRARLQLAVAAWFEPGVLLLDEPSANLDAAGRVLVENLVLEQRTRGVTLLATNDPRDVALCDLQLVLG